MQNYKLTYYKDIKSRKIDWLWYPYIPFGKITILQGDPGEGKTTFALCLIAILSNGGNLPCSDIHVHGTAVYQNSEDNNADTIKPKLEKHGANCANICFIEKQDSQITLDNDDLKKAVIDSKAKILILDPIQSFIGENIDMNRANVIRPRMNKLKQIAEETGCAILLIGHLNKNTGGKANYRGLGSIDFSAAARSVLVIGRPSNNPQLRVMAQQKSNLGPIGPSIAFTLNDGKIEWLGKYNISADELISPSGSEKETSKLMEASILLCEILSDGPKSYKEIMDKASAKGIGKRTMVEAKSNLNIKSIKRQEGWYWCNEQI